MTFLCKNVFNAFIKNHDKLNHGILMDERRRAEEWYRISGSIMT